MGRKGMEEIGRKGQVRERRREENVREWWGREERGEKFYLVEQKITAEKNMTNCSLLEASVPPSWPNLAWVAVAEPVAWCSEPDFTLIGICCHHVGCKKNKIPHLWPNSEMCGYCTHSLRQSGPNLACESVPIVYFFSPNFAFICL